MVLSCFNNFDQYRHYWQMCLLRPQAVYGKGKSLRPEESDSQFVVQPFLKSATIILCPEKNTIVLAGVRKNWSEITSLPVSGTQWTNTSLHTEQTYTEDAIVTARQTTLIHLRWGSFARLLLIYFGSAFNAISTSRLVDKLLDWGQSICYWIRDLLLACSQSWAPSLHCTQYQYCASYSTLFTPTTPSPPTRAKCPCSEGTAAFLFPEDAQELGLPHSCPQIQNADACFQSQKWTSRRVPSDLWWDLKCLIFLFWKTQVSDIRRLMCFLVQVQVFNVI